MVKTSSVMRNLKRIRQVASRRKKRLAIKEQIRINPDVLEEAVIKLKSYRN